jgi:hypothetical protein
MKRVLFALSAFVLSHFFAEAQSVQGTIVRTIPGGTTLGVFGRISTPALTNAQFLGVNVTISIPDQTGSGGNPTDAQITATSKILNLGIAPALTGTYPANPYINNGRAYYSYIMNDNGNGQGTNWAANTGDNPIAEFTFPSAGSYITGAQLNDLSSEGGPNGQMFWYVSIIGGTGDLTDYTNMFYGIPAMPPTNNGGSAPSFVELQPASVLPVKFLNFTATKSNNTAILNWAVESEDGNKASYEILKSLNGVDFSTLATIPALNNGRSNNTYTFTQSNLSAIRSSGVIYFRIKQVDKDGKFVFTEIRSVRLDSKGLVVGVYPNPIKSIANVSFDLTETANVTLTVVDASGKHLLTRQVEGVKGANTTKINMVKMATGTYTLKIQAGTELQTMPIIKAQQ